MQPVSRYWGNEQTMGGDHHHSGPSLRGWQIGSNPIELKPSDPNQA